MLAWTLAWMIGGGFVAPPEPVRYDEHALVRAWPHDAAELDVLLGIADDAWTERPGPGPVDLRMSPEAMAELRASGIDFEVRIEDVQAAIDVEAARLSSRGPDPLPAPAWFSDFRDFAAIESFIDGLAADHPELVAIEPVGTSLEGRPIRAVRLGTPAPGKTAVLYTGTMHAREWLSPMVVTCIAEAIASGAGNDARIDEILQSVVVYAVPVLNPDGYVVSWSSDRYWRKNVRDGHGVDLNRNFGWAWGGQGASPDPWAESYHGTGPFSEPESAALRDFEVAHPELVAHIDVHSYAGLVLYPWGFGYDTAPDEPVLSALASDMADAMVQATGEPYQPLQGVELYPAAGAVDDWSYGERGLMAFTIELRGDDFVVPPSTIAPACEETLQAALLLAEWAVAQADPELPPTSDDGGEDPPSGDDHGASSGDAGHDGGGLEGDTGVDVAGTDEDDAGSDPSGDAGDPGAAGPDAALPWDYGERDLGCTCNDGPSPRGGTSVLAVLAILTVRRRQGPVRGRNTAKRARESRAASAARAPRDRS